MLSQKIGNLKISQNKYEGKPLLILEGHCDKESADFLYKILIAYLNKGHKILFVDTKNLQYADIKGNMAISLANREFVKHNAKLKIISHSKQISKAMKIMRNKRYTA